MKNLLISIILITAHFFCQANCLQNTYQKEVGVREATGRNDGYDVEKYLASTGFGKGYAWCAAMVNWVHQQCGFETPESAAWSPSWFPTSKVIYHRGKLTFGMPGYQIPSSGDVFGIYFRNKGRIAHVGFIHQWIKGPFVKTFEGNTNEAGSREGDGNYYKRRLKSQIYKISRWREQA
ncbi:MAG: CHAP domain-containing protein [Bacteroidota bacterium]